MILEMMWNKLPQGRKHERYEQFFIPMWHKFTNIGDGATVYTLSEPLNMSQHKLYPCVISSAFRTVSSYRL